MGPKNVIFNPSFEVIGHRGHMSHYPENSIEGFKSAVALGVDALEMDLVVSADKQIVVSLEPFMAAASVLTADGKRINRSTEKSHNLFQMSYDSIRQYKTGLLKDRNFRDQKETESFKPLLGEVLKQVEAYRKEKKFPPIKYYLEVKSTPNNYGVFQPYPAEFTELLMQVIKAHQMENAIVVKSFDVNLLNTFNKKFPEIETSLLTYKTPIHEKLSQLEFKPNAIGPYFKLLKSKEQVEELHVQGLKIIPWTVNSERDIIKMIKLGVDGIISDYPERVLIIGQQQRN